MDKTLHDADGPSHHTRVASLHSCPFFATSEIPRQGLELRDLYR